VGTWNWPVRNRGGRVIRESVSQPLITNNPLKRSIATALGATDNSARRRAQKAEGHWSYS
jgi:hypothetical protein